MFSLNTYFYWTYNSRIRAVKYKASPGTVTPSTTTSGTSSAPQPRLGQHHHHYFILSSQFYITRLAALPQIMRSVTRQSLRETIPALHRERWGSGCSMKLNIVSTFGTSRHPWKYFNFVPHLKARLTEAGAIGQPGAAALRPVEKVRRWRRGPATIPLQLTEERSALVKGR